MARTVAGKEKMSDPHYLINNFREASIALRAWKVKTFPHGQIVRVDCKGRYEGYGIVERQDEPPDKLAVRLENGNVWWYPLDDCVKAEPSALLPLWLKPVKAVTA